MNLKFDAHFCVVDGDDVTLPYVADIELPSSGYEVPAKGIIQVGL